MPFKDPIQRKQYHKNYYETKQKNQPKKELTPPTPTDDNEYSDEDDIEIQQSKNKITPSSYGTNPINVNTEYDQFLRNREYIHPPPQHINPYIQNHIQHIRPTQHLSTQFTFV